MSRTVKDYDERRAELLAAAQELFFSKGYEVTSVQEIIDAVGIAKGTFYYYFSSKMDLLDALIEEMTAQRLAQAEVILADETLDAAQKLGRMFSEIEGWKTDNRQFFLDIMRTWYSDENAIVRDKLGWQATRAMRPMMAQVVRQGVAEGIFDTPYPKRISYIILSLLQNTSEELAFLLIAPQPGDDPLVSLEEKLAVNRYAINLLLGAQPGTVQIYNLDRLKLWFE
jgi:AcrR family transcriptional regulator